MKYIFSVIMFAFLAIGFTSCESEAPSSSGNGNNTTKELEVVPSKTSVGLYEYFTIRARMTNTPLSDVTISIDCGDGTPVRTVGAGYDIVHAYNTVGTYTVTVKAIDIFTDDTVATKTLQIIVSDVIPSVILSRESIDTTLMTNGEGILGSITFSLTTNASISEVRYQLGDGRMLSHGAIYPMSIFYETPGTYKVIADVYNDKGNYWASDTMMVTIRLPELTLDMLNGAYNISVALAVDSTSPIYKSVKSYSYIEEGVGAATSDTIGKVSWNGNSFGARYFLPTNTGGETRIKDVQFTGTLSNDLRTLESMTVSVLDSVAPTYVGKCGYVLSNLQLSGINDNAIIYRAVYRPLSTFVSDEYFKATNPTTIRSIGTISNMLSTFTLYSRYKLPYAYVVFTRK